MSPSSTPLTAAPHSAASAVERPRPRGAHRRAVRLSAAAVALAGVAVCVPGTAHAAGTTWRAVDPGASVNSKPAPITAPGYAIDGLLGSGETIVGRYENHQEASTGAYCIIAGLPSSEAADIVETLDGTTDPVTAYALSAYGAATDRDTTAAVAWIAHVRMDRGTDKVSAQARRDAFAAALADAPPGVRDRAQQILAEAEAYRAPSMDPAVLASDARLTGSAAEGTLALEVDTPEGHASTVTLEGDATFADGTRTMTVGSDTHLPLAPSSVAQGAEASVHAVVDPVEDAVTAHATQIHTYRQAGTDPRGRAFQVMVWANPTTAPLRTAEARITWRAPFTPPGGVSTTAQDAADGDAIINPGGTVQDTYLADGLAAGVTYTLETSVVTMDGATTVASSTSTFVPSGASARTVVSLELPADLAEGRYAVTQVLKAPDGSVLNAHDGTQEPSQQFVLAAPRIGTTATDKADGDKTIAHTGGTLRDTVAYENLIVGREYEVRGTVMDRASGQPLRAADGSEVTAVARFTPSAAVGTVDVDFTLEATAVGRTLVVFEEVLDADQRVVASHRDLADEGQTVVVESEPPAAPPSPAPAAPGSSLHTGGTVVGPLGSKVAGGVMASLASVVGAGIWRRRRAARLAG